MSKKKIKRYEARVKSSCKLPSVTACGGAQFNKASWSPVPFGREGELYKDMLDVREIQFVDEPAAKAAAPDIKILDTAKEMIELYGLDPEARSGPGALVPNEKGSITKAAAMDAAKTLADSLGCDLEALRAATKYEVDLVDLAIEGTGEDGLVTAGDVKDAVGFIGGVDGDEEKEPAE